MLFVSFGVTSKFVLDSGLHQAQPVRQLETLVSGLFLENLTIIAEVLQSNRLLLSN